MQAMLNFFYMNGYGYYVWSVYLIALVTVLMNLLLPLWQHARLLRLGQQR